MNNEEKIENLAEDFRKLCMKHMFSLSPQEFACIFIGLCTQLLYTVAEDDFAREIINMALEAGVKAHKRTEEPSPDLMNEILIKLFDQLEKGE